MENQYSWVISQLECYPEHGGQTEVVMTIHWRRQATDGLHMADVYGTEPLTLDPAAPFTAFSELTKEQVEGWLEDAMGAERIAEMDAMLDKQIESLINPPVIRPALPWS